MTDRASSLGVSRAIDCSTAFPGGHRARPGDPRARQFAAPSDGRRAVAQVGSPPRRVDVRRRGPGCLFLRCLHGPDRRHGQLQEPAALDHAPRILLRDPVSDPRDSGGIRQPELAMADGGAEDDGTRERPEPLDDPDALQQVPPRGPQVLPWAPGRLDESPRCEEPAIRHHSWGLSALVPAYKDRARKQAIEQFKDRFGAIFQRRHDCIHNCDRPRMSPQPLQGEPVRKVIQDVEFLVFRCNEHIDAEFRQFLIGIGCSATTVSQAGY
jgi:hypothetical protein